MPSHELVLQATHDNTKEVFINVTECSMTDSMKAVYICTHEAKENVPTGN